MRRLAQQISGSAVAALPDSAIKVLERYVNGGCLTRSDLLLSLLTPSLPFWKNAPHVVHVMRAKAMRGARAAAVRHTVHVPAYDGGNEHVVRMREYLSRHLTKELFAAYVHGSLGTGEEIAYSDFDALVILKDEVLADQRRLRYTARLLDAARRIMLDFDPLQHHGWMVMSESSLIAYSDEGLPPDSLRLAKTLLPLNGHTITIRLATPRTASDHGFNQLTDSIIKQLATRDFPGTIYQVKALLSRVLLLPALYVQARDGRGVFKGSSFALAQRDFTESDWAIMEEASRLRREWSPQLGRIAQRQLRFAHPGVRRIAVRFAPISSPELRRQLDHSFRDRVRSLIEEMRMRLYDRRVA